MSLMKIESIHAYRVHDIPEQIRRKMDINATTTKLGDVSENISQFGIDVSADPNFRTLLSDIATYDSTDNGFEIPIINVGADNDIALFNESSRIYNFIAVVTLNPINETRSTEERCIVVGYTSECEPSFGGFLPDDTKLFINDIYGLSVSYQVSPTGQRYTTDNSFRIVDNYVLANALPASSNSLFGGAESYVLPDNMMAIANMQDQYDIQPREGEVIRNTAEFRQTPQCVSANMVSPDQFALNASTGFLYGLKSLNDVNPEYSSWSNSVASQSKVYFRQKRLEMDLGANPFVETLRNHLSAGGFASRGNDTLRTGSFTLADLKMCLGNPNDVDRWISDSVSESERNLGPTYGADAWSSNTMASIMSYDIAERLSPIMSKHLVGEVTFTFSTMDYVNGELGTAVIVPESVRALDRHGKVPAVLIQAFRQVLEYGLISIVTKNHRIPVRAQVMASLGGAVRVELLVDGAPAPEAFTRASFMSGRLNTTTTSDGTYVGELASKLNKFTGAIKEGFEAHLTNEAKSNIFTDDVSGSTSDLFGGQTDSLFGASTSNDNGLFGTPTDKFKF